MGGGCNNINSHFTRVENFYAGPKRGGLAQGPTAEQLAQQPKLATGGELAVSSQVATCLNGRYGNPVAGNAALFAKPTEVKQYSVVTTTKKSGTSKIKLDR